MCPVKLWKSSFWIINIVILLWTIPSFSQTNIENPANSGATITPFVMSGQIALSFGTNPIPSKSALFISFGGPGITAKSGDWAFSFSMLPSIRIQQDDIPRPNLGFGPQISYKRFIILVPFYFDAAGSQRTLFPTFGVGYKF